MTRRSASPCGLIGTYLRVALCLGVGNSIFYALYDGSGDMGMNFVMLPILSVFVPPLLVGPYAMIPTIARWHRDVPSYAATLVAIHLVAILVGLCISGRLRSFGGRQ